MTLRRSVLLAVLLLCVSPVDGDDSRCVLCEADAAAVTDSLDDYGELQDAVRAADVPLREYVEDSFATIERGSARAVRDFGQWYRHRVEADALEKETTHFFARALQHALDAGLSFFLPGSGALASAIRTFGSEAYSFVVANAAAGDEDDTGPYLENVALELENGNDRLANRVADMFHDTSNQTVRDQMDAIRMNYVHEKRWQRSSRAQGARERTPGADTRELLRQLGIAQPGEQTYQATREQVLTALMFEVLYARGRNLPWNPGPDYWRVIAHGQALRFIVSDGNFARMFNLQDLAALDRVCKVEQKLGVAASGMTEDCRIWYRSLEM